MHVALHCMVVVFPPFAWMFMGTWIDVLLLLILSTNCTGICRLVISTVCAGRLVVSCDSLDLWSCKLSWFRTMLLSTRIFCFPCLFVVHCGLCSEMSRCMLSAQVGIKGCSWYNTIWCQVSLWAPANGIWCERCSWWPRGSQTASAFWCFSGLAVTLYRRGLLLWRSSGCSCRFALRAESDIRMYKGKIRISGLRPTAALAAASTQLARPPFSHHLSIWHHHHMAAEESASSPAARCILAATVIQRGWYTVLSPSQKRI